MYYKKLIGYASRKLTCIDIVAMRKGPKVSGEQRGFLISPISENEIFSSYKGMQDLSAPDIDGYNSKFLKITWDIIKHDTIKANKDFLDKKYHTPKFSLPFLLFI